MQFETRELVRLSEETEKAEMVKRLLETITEIESTQREAKEKASEYKGIIGEKSLKVRILRSDLGRGVITVPIEVSPVYNLETGYVEYYDRNGNLVEEFTRTLTGEEIELEESRRAAANAPKQADLFPMPEEKPELNERMWFVGDRGFLKGSRVLVLAVSKGRSGVVITDAGEVLFMDLWTILDEQIATRLHYAYTTEKAAIEDFKSGYFDPYMSGIQDFDRVSEFHDQQAQRQADANAIRGEEEGSEDDL